MKLPHKHSKGDSKLCPRKLYSEEIIKGQLKELVRGSVEETLNELLEKEAESLTQAARYERSEARQGYRSGHYDRNLTTTSGDVTLHMPRLKGVSFETAIIERRPCLWRRTMRSRTHQRLHHQRVFRSMRLPCWVKMGSNHF